MKKSFSVFCVSASVAVVFFGLLFFASCKRGDDQKSRAAAAGATELQLSSTAFPAQGAIPAKYTCTAQNVSPPLQWQNAPSGTQNFALIMQDLDAPMGTFTHWMMWNIPAASSSLPEAIPNAAHLADGSTQGTNDFRKIGYGGPCPPAGETHRYRFALYALDVALALDSSATVDRVEQALQGHTLAKAELRASFRK